ncbi:unnamed protein product [Rhizophagus irregularis]|nr:unnamed protein product [Rhizophagus irregularis]
MEALTTIYPNNMSENEDSIANEDSITQTIINNTYRTKEHWTEVLHDNQNIWLCLHCNVKQYSSNTSRTHLKNHTLSCLNNNMTKSNSIKPVIKEEVDNSIIDLVVDTGMPFNVLNSSLFHRMVSKLHCVLNSYKVPHPTTISRYLSENIYETRFGFIKNLLAKMPGRISLTCDGWHSTAHRCHYTVVMGSWISDDWRMVNIILNFQKSGQTAKDTTSVIMNTLNNYDIKNKLFALTMDNTTTNKAVTQLLQRELPNVNIIFIGLHKVVKYLANPLANGRLELLKSYCQVIGIDFLRPILEIDTRWNSTLAMFERYILLHLAIKEMCLKEPSMPPCLETEELAELESICQILKPFEDATAVLSKDQSNSISDALTVILEIKQHISKAKSNNLMIKKFKKYWDVIADHILIAHILDPRYKMEHLRITIIDVGEYTENEANQYVNSVHEKIILYGARYSTSPSTTSTIIVNDIETFSRSFPKRRILKRRRVNTNTIDYELELYEMEPLEEFENNNNGILYWKSLSN